MQIEIQSLHFQAKPELQEFVVKKVARLSHLDNHITACNVYLRLDKSENRENKVCELEVHVPGNILFVKRAARTFEEATTEAVHAMQEQLRGIKV